MSITKLLRLLPVVLYLVLSLLYLALIPTGESPDEPGHMQCIEQVSLKNQLPQVDPKPQGERWFSRGRIISGRMCYHMPLYYLLGGVIQRSTAIFVDVPLHYEFPASNLLFPEQSAAMFVQVTSMQPIPVLVLRFLSILLGLGALWATLTLTRRLFPEQEMVAILASLFVAGWPQVVFLSRAINNDALANGLSVILLGVLAGSDKPGRFILAGLLSALALLTKLTVFFTVWVVCVMWLGEFVRSPGKRQVYLQAMGICLIFWLGIVLLLLLHPLLNAHLRSSTSSFTSLSERTISLIYWQEVFQQTLSSGWARFGWMNIPSPSWHTYLWWSLMGVTATLGFRHIKANRSVCLLLLAWFMGVGLTYIRINMTIFQPQFRFVLSILPIFAALAASGWWHMSQNHYYRLLLVGLLPFFLLFYNVWLLFFVIKPVYQ